MENPSADVEMDQFETVSELPAEENQKDAVEKMETDEKPKTEVARKQAPPIEVKKELPVEDADWEIGFEDELEAGQSQTEVDYSVNYREKLVENMTQVKADKDTCDVILRVKKGNFYWASFWAHRSVLIANSPVFAEALEKFASYFSTGMENQRKIHALLIWTVQPLIDELENIFGKFSSAGCKLIDEEVEDAEVVGTENDDNEDEKKEEKKRSHQAANKPAAEAKDEPMKEEPAEGTSCYKLTRTGSNHQRARKAKTPSILLRLCLTQTGLLRTISLKRRRFSRKTITRTTEVVEVVADEEITADSTITEAATGVAAAAVDPEVVASEVAGTGHRSMEIMATTADSTEEAGTDHQHTDHQADMADHEVATGVQEAAMVALEVDSMEGTATVVVDIITTAVVTAKAMAEEEAVSALEDGAVRTRDFCSFSNRSFMLINPACVNRSHRPVTHPPFSDSIFSTYSLFRLFLNCHVSELSCGFL
ncbi:unnamed protein product [Oikopleura dioica]|uniref:BTB domain-containing protein n=1 Tax=Oikopleura dioica TaxID=34765 RepID=E4Z070_OIKDI|nr:unnamed protein product [Oikopleura dioica]